jgi:fructose-specific phosphotransferase system IIA component
MKLSSLLTSSLIKIGVEATEKNQAITELVQFLVDQHHLENFDVLLEKVMSRENKMTTGIGSGIAVPHAKSSLVDKMVMVCGVSYKGVKYESVDSEEVKLLFLMISPSNITGPHIQTLANISRIMGNEELREGLKNAPNAEVFLDILVKGEEHL